MKKLLIIAIMAISCAFCANAQKFALVDMDYVLRNVPAYEMANEQLNQVSLRWEKEVAELSKEAETMYKNYQADMVFLTDDQKRNGRKKSSQRKKRSPTPVTNISAQKVNFIKSVSRS